MNFDSIEHCLIFEIDDEKYKKHWKLIKLCKQFGHASPNNFKNLFKNAEVSKLINEVCDNCVVCKTHKKPPQTATTFNLTVAMDLHSLYRNIWYFHIIDQFTQFSNTTIMKKAILLLLLRTFFKTGLAFLTGHQKCLVIMGESLFLKSCQIKFLQHLQNLHVVMEYVSNTMLSWLKSF